MTMNPYTTLDVSILKPIRLLCWPKATPLDRNSLIWPNYVS